MYKILVVDDEPDIVNLLKDFLTKMNFEVVTAAGGEEAIALLHSDIKVDLVILDMKMPKVRGADVLREMKKLNKRWPVIILTGSIDIKKHERELKDLIYYKRNYLIKPIDLNVLLDAVKKILKPDRQGG